MSENDAESKFGKIAREAADRLGELISENDEDIAERVLDRFPDSERVVTILKIFVNVLLGGRFSSRNGTQSEFRDSLFGELERGARLLFTEVERALSVTSCQDVSGLKAEQIVVHLLSVFPELRRRILEDIRAAYRGDPAADCHAEVTLTYPGILAVSVFRIANELWRLRVPFIPRMMAEWAHSETGIDIHPGATIGSGFFVDHGTGVVIGETAVIGNNVKLYQGAILGARSFALDESGNPVKHIKRHPTVEDNVVIYSNAIVLGGDTVVGAGSTIGGSVFLTKSVPPNTLVMNQPPDLRIKTEDPGTYEI